MFKWLKRFFKHKPPKILLLDDGTATAWFRNTRVGMPLNGGVTITAGGISELLGAGTDRRLEITPSDLIKFLEAGANISLEGIDEKIAKLRERQRFWKETLKRRAPLELNHAVIMLEARKKYPDLKASIPWKTTTKERIEEICKKYSVEHHGLDQFIPELPPEAVEEAAKFAEVMDVALADYPDLKTPVLSVVAPAKLFKTRKGDPILLAASPFGEFYYVLCAWDKEVRFVEELLS
jgi:hypothetical protein